MKFTEVKKDLESLKIRNYHRVWAGFMRKYNCAKVLELGVYKGDNFMEMIEHSPELAVAVDSWHDSGEHPRKYDDYKQDEFDEQYQFFKDRVKNFPFVQIVREDTIKASKLFPDNYFDFIYIDADHSYESCLADILAWYPKVKKGKFLAGHDYRRGFGVPGAVNKFIEDKKLKLILLPPSNWLVIKK